MYTVPHRAWQEVRFSACLADGNGKPAASVGFWTCSSLRGGEGPEIQKSMAFCISRNVGDSAAQRHGRGPVTFNVDETLLFLEWSFHLPIDSFFLSTISSRDVSLPCEVVCGHVVALFTSGHHCLLDHAMSHLDFLERRGRPNLQRLAPSGPRRALGKVSQHHASVMHVVCPCV